MQDSSFHNACLAVAQDRKKSVCRINSLANLSSLAYLFEKFRYMDWHFETSRLVLRPLEKNDAPALFTMDSDPEVARYTGMPPLTDPAASSDIIRDILEQYQKHGTGRLAVVEKASDTLIGWAGVKWITGPLNGVENFYELGYRFRRSHWGKGFASEASSAVVNSFFMKNPNEALYAYVDIRNPASSRVLEKMGFRFQGIFTDMGDLCSWHSLHPSDFKNLMKTVSNSSL